jgi:hypothetical protein
MFAMLATLLFYAFCLVTGIRLAIWIYGEEETKRMQMWQRLLLGLAGGFVVYQVSLQLMAGLVDLIRRAAQS